jgi:hypothetical protein
MIAPAVTFGPGWRCQPAGELGEACGGRGRDEKFGPCGDAMIAATSTYSVGQVVWTILWFFLLFIEVWLTISIFIDIFRSHDLKGWQKALWVVLVLILPLVGILAYFIVRGDKMRAHQEQAQLDEKAVDEFLRRRHASGGGGGGDVADQLSRLAQLRQDGVISDQEFEQLKSRVIKQDSGTAT